MFLAIVAAALSEDGGVDANRGGGDGREEPNPEEAEGSEETFTRENYPQLVSDPDAHEGAKVDVTGEVFTTPEIVEGETAFQMYVDPANGEWNTAVLADGTELGLETDD